MINTCCKTALCIGLLTMMLVNPEGAFCESRQKPNIEKDQPIQIASDRMDAYNDKRMVVFSGNAVATQGARTIRAESLTLYYRDDQKRPGRPVAGVEGEGMGSLERVEAKGQVRITEDARIVTGEEAVFEQETQKITMTGSAVMSEGENIIRGDRIVVFLNENRGVVEGVGNRRVTATIYPRETKKQ